MTLGFVHIHQFRGNLFLGKKLLKHLAHKNLFKVFEFKKRGHPEHPISVKTSSPTQYMQVRMESKEVAKCLHRNNGPRDGGQVSV